MKYINIGIIGLGPRGLSVLERCIAYLRERPVQNIRLYLFDPQEPGCGCHAQSQPEYFLVNTIASQITQFSDASVCDAGPILSGPSFYEWIATNKKISTENLSPNAYYSRALFGEYLNSVFHHLLTLYPKPNLLHHRVFVEDLFANQDGTWRLVAGDKSFNMDYLFLTTGHGEKQLSRADIDLAEQVKKLQNINPLLMLIQNPYPVVDKLQAIHNKQSVLIEGAGLTTCDIIAELTNGRGGRFTCEDNKMIYHASGFEPKITVYSRSGIPLSARAVNQKSVSGQYKPKFITFQAIRRLKEHSDQLDFEQQIMPLLLRELAYVYYFTLIKKQFDLATAEQFSNEYIHAGSDDERNKLVNKYVSEESRFSWERIIHPVPPDLNQKEFKDWLIAFLQEDIENATEGNINNPLKAACDVLRDIRDVIRSAVDYAGLTEASHKKFLSEFVPIMNRLAVGPPKIRIQEWIALMEAGILNFDQGPAPNCELDVNNGVFTLNTTQFDAPVIRGDVLIKAKVEMPGPLEAQSPFMQNMIHKKIARPFKNGNYPVGGIEVDRQLNVVSAQGSIIKNIWALGILTEGCKFYTFVVPRPGVNSTAIVDAGRAVKQMMTDIFQKAHHYVA